jgi:hypothetical protein
MMLSNICRLAAVRFLYVIFMLPSRVWCSITPKHHPQNSFTSFSFLELKCFPRRTVEY